MTWEACKKKWVSYPKGKICKLNVPSLTSQAYPWISTERDVDIFESYPHWTGRWRCRPTPGWWRWRRWRSAATSCRSSADAPRSPAGYAACSIPACKAPRPGKARPEPVGSNRDVTDTVLMTNFLFWRITDQLQVEADELQAGHQREEEREVVMTADQSVPDVEEKQLLTVKLHTSVILPKRKFNFHCDAINAYLK